MPPSSTLGILSGLLAALTWGGGDYLGGFAARRLKNFQVLLLVASAGLAVMLSLALLSGEPWLSRRGLFFATCAGISGSLGVTALYRGLTLGNTAFVAPFSAMVGAMVPIAYEIGRGNPPSPTQMAGFGLALLSIWLVSQSSRQHTPNRLTGFPQALIAGLGFGGFFILIAQVPEKSVFMPLVVVKSAAVCLALILLAVRREQLPSARHNPLALLAGVLDAGGNVFYLLAAQWARLDVAAVLGSMSPAVVVLLARGISREAINRWQWAGVVMSVVAVSLITI
jgi:drug/metabolite transporter (DMT)-like permease